MAMTHVCDDGWVCEQHPDLEYPHDDCAGPGMPCGDCNPDGERRPEFDVLYASTSEPASTNEPETSILRRYDRHQGPEPIGEMWTLAKGDRQVRCALSTHDLGWELRATLGGELIRSQVCKSEEAVFETSGQWRAEVAAKGWTETG